MFRGSCHCGAVRYEIHGEIHGFKHCHCITCRKIHGTVYGSSALTPTSGFRVVAGEDRLRRYESSPGKRRCFCENCGSHVFAYQERDPDLIILRLGTIDDLGPLTPVAHIWVSHRAPWYAIPDDVLQFTEGHHTP